ncbi:hypothetical protein AN641_02500 [Candidatus Epulonipiscioides gigas]|nr:hypothetical protein AN641_02500 [Epulopiscium sp. SCG-C07WGA-EpuloA2]
MKKKINSSMQYSYYMYRNRKNQKKKIALIIGIFLFIVINIYLKKFYNPTVKNEKFLLSKDVKDFEQNDISFDIHKEVPIIRGLYIPAHKANNLDKIVEIANTTEINSFIIDVKDDSGYLTFASHNEVLLEAGSIRKNPKITDINVLMDTLYRNNIYPIARIVVFKDNVVDANFPERMVLSKNGEVYVNKSEETWLNPYDTNNWEYILEICKEAILVGFKEIQFDYIRFHESMNSSTVDLPTDISRTQIITDFVDFMVENLEPYGVSLGADVFGTIITSKADAAIIGQDYKEFVKKLDSVCPMIYPSHYGRGSFGQEFPDLNPYEIIFSALKVSNEVIRQIPIEERKAKIIPYLQDFTATWITPHQEYTAIEIREQIQAVYDAILNDWILWNGAANYTKEALEAEIY